MSEEVRAEDALAIDDGLDGRIEVAMSRAEDVSSAEETRGVEHTLGEVQPVFITR